ncbi:HlyD family secretion protein [Candidatus Rariloculus sp.]|uniref:HlyD family secretion protein n=1 Tax=Candidatus Rariloculus sp. TaxID=3101265 RepID=UPI003D0B9D53
MRRENALLETALVAAAALAAASCERAETPLPIVGTLERDRIELVAEANEPIVEILVTEGDAVTAGQTLLRLDPAVHATRLARARANRDRADQRFAELARGPRQERILEARARVDGAREDLASQRREHERMQSLLERNLASPSDLDRAYSRRELAEAEFERATALLDELLEGTTAEELGQARAALDEAEAMLAEAEISAARLDLEAPRAGVVETLLYELGERPPRGATVAVLLADSAPYARVYIPEPIRARVTPGLQAFIRIDGIAEPYAGEVRFVAADAAFTPYYSLTQRDRSRLSYPAEVTLTGDRARTLPTGVPVEVDFPSLAPVPD